MADSSLRSGQIWESPRPHCDGAPSASVWPSPRQTPGPLCLYPLDRTPPDASMKRVGAPSAWSSHSYLNKKESDGLDLPQGVAPHAHRGVVSTPKLTALCPRFYQCYHTSYTQNYHTMAGSHCLGLIPVLPHSLYAELPQLTARI